MNGEREGEARATGSRVPSPAVRLLVVAAAGYLYGTLSARVPGTSDPTAFWVGNLAAPYLLIPFLAGTWRFRAIGSAVAGAVAAVAAVAGFYRFLVVWHTTSTNLGIAIGTPTRTVIARAYGYWFRNLALGDPGGRPWLSIALVAERSADTSDTAGQTDEAEWLRSRSPAHSSSSRWGISSVYSSRAGGTPSISRTW